MAANILRHPAPQRLAAAVAVAGTLVTAALTIGIKV